MNRVAQMNRTSLCYLAISPCMWLRQFIPQHYRWDVCEKQLFPSIRTLVMEFETKIYPQIGGYGRYNRIITLFSWFPNFAVSLKSLQRCFLHTHSRDLPLQTWSGVTRHRLLFSKPLQASVTSTSPSRGWRGLASVTANFTSTLWI